jgi:hypothetical protein
VPLSPLGSRDDEAAGDWLDGCRGKQQPAWSSIAASSRWDSSLETVTLSSKALQQLDRALSALPARQRRVVTMRDICGMDAEEVCAASTSRPRTSASCCTGLAACCVRRWPATTVDDRSRLERQPQRRGALGVVVVAVQRHPPGWDPVMREPVGDERALPPARGGDDQRQRQRVP